MPAIQRFPFQQLEVYQVAKAVAQLMVEHRSRWTELPGGLDDRMARAMTELLAAIAAGAAHGLRAEQRRSYQAARANASEAMSCLEVAQLHSVLPSELKATLGQQLQRVDTMLKGMINRRNS